MDEALLAAFRATDYLVCPDEADLGESQAELAQPATVALARAWAAATSAHSAPGLEVPAAATSAALADPWASAAPAPPALTALTHPWASWLCIRVGRGLPAALQALAAGRPWGVITAWHPRSQARPDRLNLTAQCELLAALRAWPDVVLRSAIGVGVSGWYEPSLFAIGPDGAMLDRLGRQYRQHAYVHGCGDTTAQLRWLDN